MLCPLYSAACTISSTSISLSLVNGLGMFNNSMTFFPPIVTTKAPFRGFSAFTLTFMPAASKTLTTLAARVRNTPQLLQCSIEVSQFSIEAVFPFAAGEAFSTLADALAADFFVVLAPAFPIMLKPRTTTRSPLLLKD